MKCALEKAQRMPVRSISADFGLLLAAIFLLSAPGSDVQAGLQPFEGVTSIYEELYGKAKEGVRGPIGHTHYYWDQGLQIVSPHKNFELKIGGGLLFDAGDIDADDDLQRAFPDLDGPEADFRQLHVYVLGKIYHAVDFKFDIDFANVREIKDNWFRITKTPLLRPFKFGHQKEPFSLENLTSLTNTTFMERALPTKAFSPGRNIGIGYNKATLDERMTWAVGGFLNTGSASDIGDTKDQISEANGVNLTARVTGLPWYADKGERLLHLGLSYSHQFRKEPDRNLAGARYRARPESFLTDDRLVDTGDLFTDGQDLITPELAVVSGPLSFQGEYFHAFVDAAEDLQFWGYYIYGSYFLTGEHRSYDTSRGDFSRVRPKKNFNPREGGWGALELALRYSYIDLNDGAVRGGKETDFTAGLNWYLGPEVRLMLNYIQARVKDRATPPAVDNGRASILQGRFQVDF